MIAMEEETCLFYDKSAEAVADEDEFTLGVKRTLESEAVENRTGVVTDIRERIISKQVGVISKRENSDGVSIVWE